MRSTTTQTPLSFAAAMPAFTVSSGAFAQIVITCPPCFWVSRLFFPPESIVL